MREPLPPPQEQREQQQCSAPPPNGPQEEQVAEEEVALHLDHPASDPQAYMQPSADAAAAAPAHADRQTEAPAFWSSSTRHCRTAPYHSISHVGGPGPIQLEDHSEEQHELSQGCWARSVTVDDYTVVSGTSGIGAYVVWHLTVSTLKGGDMSIRKRYVVMSDPRKSSSYLLVTCNNVLATRPARPNAPLRHILSNNVTSDEPILRVLTMHYHTDTQNSTACAQTSSSLFLTPKAASRNSLAKALYHASGPGSWSNAKMA